MVDGKSLHCQKPEGGRTEQDTPYKVTRPFEKEREGILEKGVCQQEFRRP